MKRVFLPVVALCILFPGISLALSPTHNSKSTSKLLSTIRSWFWANEISVTVKDEDGAPIREALVMIGNSPDDPFPGNVAYTDENGYVNFVNEKLEKPITATAYAEGHNAYTIYDINADKVEITLTKLSSSEEWVKARGELEKWQPMSDYDDLFSAGFLIPLLSLDDLIDFDMRSILGPDCLIDLYGERNVPCNLVIPEQSEFYVVMPVSVSKPSYSLDVQNHKTQDFLALTGDLPFTETVDLLLGGDSFVGVLNKLQVKKAGLLLDLPVTGPFTRNIPLDYRIETGKISVEIGNRPSEKSLIIISAADYSNMGKQLIPSGIRIIPRREALRRVSLSTIVKSGDLATAKDVVAALATNIPTKKGEGSYKDTGSIVGVLKRDLKGIDEKVVIDSFFLPLTLSPIQNGIQLSDVINPNISPAPDLNIVALRRKIKQSGLPENDETLWSAVAPPDRRIITLPTLPVDIIPDPSTTPENDTLYWSATVFALAEPRVMFDYHTFSSRDFALHLTHFSWNKIGVEENGQAP